MPKDYYIVLGVGRDANLNKIKKAYRRVAKKYHPDIRRSQESAEKFHEIREAYETLGDGHTSWNLRDVASSPCSRCRQTSRRYRRSALQSF
ncbi:DnaJ domain-containing protein [bacterium]|nr:DnaJ domain-containing protein [bacterium]